MHGNEDYKEDCNNNLCGTAQAGILNSKHGLWGGDGSFDFYSGTQP